MESSAQPLRCPNWTNDVNDPEFLSNMYLTKRNSLPLLYEKMPDSTPVIGWLGLQWRQVLSLLSTKVMSWFCHLYFTDEYPKNETTIRQYETRHLCYHSYVRNTILVYMYADTMKPLRRWRSICKATCWCWCWLISMPLVFNCIVDQILC
jgi:hypothetical protein